MNIEPKIKELLAENKATVKDLADHIGVTRQGIYGMLRQGTLTLAKLKLTAEYFKVTIAELVGEAIKPKSDAILEQTIEQQAQEIKNLKRIIDLQEFKIESFEKRLEKKS